MATTESRLRIVAELTDKATGGLKTLGGTLIDLMKTEKAVTDVSKKAGVALTAAATAGGAFLVSATKLAARVETLGVVIETLGQNAGYSETEMQGFEDAIKSQGITLQSTRQAMATMLQAQIDLADGADLARLAQNAAVIANINSSEAYERLVYVIQTGNVLMGRRLGLSLQFGRALDEEAAKLGKTAEQLNAQEIIQARTNEVMRAGETIAGAYSSAMETAGKKVLSLDRHIEESRRIIGEAYLPIFADIVDKVTEVLEAFEKMSPAQQRQIAVTLGMSTAWAGLAGGGLLLVSMLPNLITGFQKLGVTSSTALGPIGLIVTALAVITTHLVASAAATNALADAADELNSAHGRAADTYEDYVKNIEEAAEANEVLILSQEEYNHRVKMGEDKTHSLRTALILLTEEEWNWERSVVAAREAQDENTRSMWDAYATYKTGEASIAYLSATMGKLATQQRNARLEAQRAAEANRGIAVTSSMAGAAIDTELTGSIASFLDELEFFIAGGYDLQLQFLAVKQAIEEGKISPEEAQAYTEALFVAAQDLQVEMGNISAYTAAANIREQLGGSLQEATDRLNEIDETLSGLGRQVDAYIQFHTTGTVPGVEEYIPMQHGGSGVVPPGFNRDNFLLGLSSGERYNVTPAGGSHREVNISEGAVQVQVGSGVGMIESQIAFEDALMRAMESQL